MYMSTTNNFELCWFFTSDQKFCNKVPIFQIVFILLILIHSLSPFTNLFLNSSKNAIKRPQKNVVSLPLGRAKLSRP